MKYMKKLQLQPNTTKYREKHDMNKWIMKAIHVKQITQVELQNT